MILLSLIFVQDLLKLSKSFKDSRIRINYNEMGSYESDKCSRLMYFNERRHRTCMVSETNFSREKRRPIPGPLIFLGTRRSLYRL